MPHVAALDGEQEMNGFERVAQLIREAGAELSSDLDRMDKGDELRKQRDEAQASAYHLFASANEHDRLERQSTGTQRIEHRLMSQRLWGEYDIARKEYLRLDRELAALLPPSDAGSFLDHEESYLRQRAAAGCAVTYHGD
jgi:hypothetical protein